MERRRVHVGFWWEIQKEKDHWVRPGSGCENKTKMGLREIRWDCMD
jgi:hypothetical protein